MKYRIERQPGQFVIGTKIQTRGNDEEFPNFILEDGTQYGSHISRVTAIEDECDPHGIERPTFQEGI